MTILVSDPYQSYKTRIVLCDGVVYDTAVYTGPLAKSIRKLKKVEFVCCYNIWQNYIVTDVRTAAEHKLATFKMFASRLLISANLQNY